MIVNNYLKNKSTEEEYITIQKTKNFLNIMKILIKFGQGNFGYISDRMSIEPICS